MVRDIERVETYTITEFAKRIGKNRGYVYKMIREGVLIPKETITGLRYFTEEDVKKYFGEK